MTTYLVRHAHAGQRTTGFHDQFRPLSSRGHKRAEELVGVFSALRLGAVWSSPYTRCVQTVEPLADGHGLVVEEFEEFGEHLPVNEALAVMAMPPDTEHLVVCSHGNLIPEILGWLVEKDRISTTGRGCEKGSIWALERRDGKWISATYLAMTTASL